MPRVTVVIPTLAADDALAACLESLRKQTWRDFETVVVDNSGKRRVPGDAADMVIHHAENRGFGGAINGVYDQTDSEFLAVLNDDAVAHPEWLAALIGAATRHPRAGMFASRVRLADHSGDARRLDSAGMLLCADASSKQRGHGQDPERFAREEEALFPSGSAAMYRRSALRETGPFDADFFLYCEDTDLGLRLRWAGWSCIYAPDAVVDHRYSHSAGRASPLKAYLVERNRLRVAVKNFPLRMCAAAPFVTVWRYAWHLAASLTGKGAAGAFREEHGGAPRLAWFALKAHLALITALPSLLRARASMPKRITSSEFTALARRHAISAREVAAL